MLRDIVGGRTGGVVDRLVDDKEITDGSVCASVVGLGIGMASSSRGEI